jgi:catechol 2,3-dioxygenase-like lactoylglutathione lyase family enzyme
MSNYRYGYGFGYGRPFGDDPAKPGDEPDPAPVPRPVTDPLASVDQARARLRLDGDFPEADIALALAGASEAVMAYLKRATNYTDEDPAPPQVVNAVLLLTGIFIRDPDGVEAHQWQLGFLPMAVQSLVYQLRDPATE